MARGNDLVRLEYFFPVEGQIGLRPVFLSRESCKGISIHSLKNNEPARDQIRTILNGVTYTFAAKVQFGNQFFVFIQKL